MRRWTLRISLVLIIGWVLNIASGWVCERFVGQEWMYEDFHADGANVPPPPDMYEWILANAPREGFHIVLPFGLVKRSTAPGVEHVVMASGGEHFVSSILRHRVGWPLKSAESHHWTCLSYDSMSGEAHDLIRQDNMIGTSPWNLRTTPLWRGTIGNTLFYAVILFGLFYARAAKRAFRRTRGRCPKCAYDLQGDLDAGCPECGWNRTAHHDPGAGAAS